MSHSREPTVRAAALTGLGALCRSYGVDAGPLLRRAGLPATVEAEPDVRVSVPAVNLAFELAAQACHCDDFGLRLSELRGFSNLGPISLLARDEPTIGAAMAAIEAYLPLHNDALAITREWHGDVLILRSAVLTRGPKAQAVDIAVAMQHRILRHFAGALWQAEEVCLSRPRPANTAKFHQVLGSRIRFDADFDGIVLRADLFEQPNPLADSALRSYAGQMLRLSDPAASERMTDRVRRLLALLLSSRRCTAGYIARQLGLSRRTLTRALHGEGTHFMTLLDAERSDVALRHLAASGRSLSQISDLLGFSSPAAFSTWFRGQFGQNPRAWRKANGAQ